jgi:hypothetical protein
MPRHSFFTISLRPFSEVRHRVVAKTKGCVPQTDTAVIERAGRDNTTTIAAEVL